MSHCALLLTTTFLAASDLDEFRVKREPVYRCECVRVGEERGKRLHEDAIPGLGTLNGVAIDSQDNLYVLSAAPQIIHGQPHFNDMAGTLMKFRPRTGKIINQGQGAFLPPLPEDIRRNPDLYCYPGEAWINGADWSFGGIGWGGKNRGNGCACWNCRFALDYFGRSFAPEMDRYSVAVLDTNGILIVRIGTYGNVDDGAPSDARGGPPTPRNIGGDEVALFYAPYVTTHTDRRLFIADAGNARILSVRLDYHTTERIPLKEVRP